MRRIAVVQMSHEQYQRQLHNIRRRAQAMGIRGYAGGWICRPGGRTICQGWEGLRLWAQEQAHTDANLTEILYGTRIGVPTLDITRDDQLAVALLSPLTVSARSGDASMMIRGES